MAYLHYCTVGGIDQSAYFKDFQGTLTGDGTIGSGTLYLDQQAGGLSITTLMTVAVWQPFNTAGAGIKAGGRLFQGVCKVRTTTTIGTTKVWVLDCWDNNVILQLVVRDVQSAKALVLTAGTLAAQIAQLGTIIQQNGYGAVNTQVDCTTGVALTTAMPGVTYPGGHKWAWYIDQLCYTAQGAASTAGVVTSVSITNAGSGYTVTPTVTVAPPPAGGTQATVTAAIGGAGPIKALTLTNGGTGYTGTLTVTITGGGGSGATATASATSGVVTSLSLTAAGSGYTSTPTVTITGSVGSGATATAAVSKHLTSLTISNGGRGYPNAPALTIVGDGQDATASSVVSAVVYNTRPRYFMGMLTTFGVSETFGAPVLYVYDGLLTPTPSVSFSDVPTGGRKPPFGTFKRVEDASAPVVQRQQSTWGSESFVTTSLNAAMQAQYPNPFINHGGASNTGYWMAEPIQDTDSTSFAEAQAALDRVVAAKSIPRDTFTFDTYERVMPGDLIGLGWSLEGIPDDTPYRVAQVRISIEAPNNVLSKLTVNSRRLGLFDDGAEEILAPPIEGDHIPPLPPSAFSLTTNVYNPANRHADLTFLIGASLSPDASGYQIVGRVNSLPFFQDVGASLTPTITLESGVAFSLKAQAYDNHRNFSETYPANPIQGTTAVYAQPLPPTITGITHGRDKSGAYFAKLTMTQPTGSQVLMSGFVLYHVNRGPDDSKAFPIPPASPFTLTIQGLGLNTYFFKAFLTDIYGTTSDPSVEENHQITSPPVVTLGGGYDDAHPDDVVPNFTDPSYDPVNFPLVDPQITVTTEVIFAGKSSMRFLANP